MFSYKKPELHEIVFVKLKDVKSNDMGNYVDLIDYDNIEGLILCTEITKYNANIKKIVKKDEIFPVIITDISDKNNYDLSYSKIRDESRNLLKECYEFSTKIYKLINKVSENINLDKPIKDELIKYNITIKLYENSVNSKQNLYKNLYESILTNPLKLFENYENCDDKIIVEKIKKNISENLIMKPNIIHKEFKLLMFEEHSLCKLKEILNKIKQLNIVIECKSSPIYYYKLTNVNISDIDSIVENIQKEIENIISEYNCNYSLFDGYQIIKKGEIYFNF
jgi:translation initiation factor 2 subunit 1